MANNKSREEALKQQKIRQYKLSVKNLKWFPVAAAAVLIIVLALISLNWAAVFNTDINGIEVKITGWDCLGATLTGKFSSVDYGDMAMPFYYYAKDYCLMLGAFTLMALIFIVVNIILQAIAFFTKQHYINIISAVLDVLCVAMLFACFAVAISMKNSEILPVYCAGNPACSIQSLAFVPAILAIGALAIHAVCLVKLFMAKSALRRR